jgi:hypothetical protein
MVLFAARKCHIDGVTKTDRILIESFIEGANPNACMCAYRVRENRIPGTGDCVAWTARWLGQRSEMNDYLSVEDILEEWESGVFFFLIFFVLFNLPSS